MNEFEINRCGDTADAASPALVDDLTDASRLTRRAAMRAAVGGAVAAGIFIAPRVEGLSVVPNYAAAASAGGGGGGGHNGSPSGGVGASEETRSDLGTTTRQANTTPLCRLKCCVTCWNNSGVATNCGTSSCNCGTNKSCGDAGTDASIGTLTVNRNSPGDAFNLNYALWGPTEGCSNQTPSLTLTTGGIDPPFESCDVIVTGTCGSGTFHGGGSVTGLTANGSVGPFAPSCSGSLDNSAPAASRCPAPATVTITLACTF